jgi:hypothetical protein
MNLGSNYDADIPPRKNEQVSGILPLAACVETDRRTLKIYTFFTELKLDKQHPVYHDYLLL